MISGTGKQILRSEILGAQTIQLIKEKDERDLIIVCRYLRMEKASDSGVLFNLSDKGIMRPYS